jgi:predicted oxidoreductase
MQTISLGVSSLKSTRLAYGCWRVAGTWDPAEVTPASRAAGCRAILAAYEAGYTLFDNADIYCGGEAERILGAVLKEVSGMRDRVLIATKCGIRPAGAPQTSSPQRYDFSAEHIRNACDQSLKRLGIEHIDLYLLHRPDYLANPEEIAKAFSELKAAGKVGHFGVSNFRTSLVTALQVACPMPLVTHQIEISLAKLDAFTKKSHPWPGAHWLPASLEPGPTSFCRRSEIINRRNFFRRSTPSPKNAASAEHAWHWRGSSSIRVKSNPLSARSPPNAFGMPPKPMSWC